MYNRFSSNNISIDASSVCQLKCPECSTTKGLIKRGVIGSGFLKFIFFKNFILQNQHIESVELSNWGEIFLNPQIIQIMRFAFENNVRLTAGNGVNFNTLSDDTIEALVKYQFGYLNISIDGTSQETYEQYRVKGEYEVVIANIKKLNFYKEKYKCLLPKLAWQFIIFGHNEHEIPVVKQLCQELNMAFHPRLNHSSFSPIKYADKVKMESGLDSTNREEYRVNNGKYYKRPCCQLWSSPQVSWDGKLLGCCVNKWESFGNVFEEGLEACLKSELYENTLLTLRGLKNLDKSIPCFKCQTFKQIQDQPITDAEIEQYSKFIHPAERG